MPLKPLPPKKPPSKTRATRVSTMFSPPATAASETMAPWRVLLHDVIFEADTVAGRRFDVALLWAIMISVLAVMLESVQSIDAQYGWYLRTIEWTLTGLFTLEYVLRVVSVRKPTGYIFSFFGLVDLISVIPTYLSLVFAGTHVLAVVRLLRVLRVFRLFKLSQFVGEAENLVNALLASSRKIIVFMGVVLTLVVIFGTAMYWIEGHEAGFDSIPRSIYWAIVTLTTVGYGDISPQTPLGQFLAATVMIFGYAILAVPTGIVSAEIASASSRREVTTRTCPECVSTGHDVGASFCKHCGARLHI